MILGNDKKQGELPKYRQLIAMLSALIRSGAFPVGGRFPTEYALAEEYGTSRHTVRMALAELERDGYLERRRRSGTIVREPVSSSVKSGRVKVVTDVGVLVPRVTLALYPGIVQGVEDVCSRAGCHVIIGNCMEDRQRENRYITEMIQRPVAGLVICPSHNSISTYYYRLTDRDIPFILVDAAVDGIDSDLVSTNNFQGARDGVKLLVTTGCRNIAFIGGYQRSSTTRERLAGFRAGLEDAGYGLNEAMVFSGGFTPEFGYEAARHILSSGEKVDGLFIANDPITVGAVRALREAGVGVPGDMRICTFDDPDLPIEEQVPLFVIRQPRLEEGRTSARILLERIAERKNKGQRAPSRVVRLDAEIVIPKTSGKLNGFKGENRDDFCEMK